MKVLRVISSMNPSGGGPCQGIRNSIPELAKLGIESEVVSLDDPSQEFLTKEQFPIHALGPAIGPWNYSAKLIPWLKDNLNKFDAVIIHGLWLYNSYAVNRVVQYLNKNNSFQDSSKLNPVPKLYVMPHGMLDPYFQNAKGRRFKAIRNWLYWKFIEAKVVNDADALLFTCEVELKLARIPFHPYHPKQELNVGYGVASPPGLGSGKSNEFLSAFPQFKDEPYILFLSRIHEKKGVDLLINAYSNLIAKGLKLPKLVIAGPGIESAYGEKLNQLVQENEKLSSSVFFAGMLQGGLKWGAFYGCEAFILPSHQENFGIAVAEALACGTPVLISNQVNIWEEIENGGAGFVQDDSLEGAIKLIKNWIGLSNDQKQLMRYNAKKTFETFFAIEPAAKRLVTQVFA